MKRSVTNSFDNNIQDTSSYIVGLNFDYTGGTYEFTANNKFIKIIAYTNTNDTLKIYHSYNSDGTTQIAYDEFFLNDESRVFLLEVRSNFYKLEVISTDTNITRKRVYNSYLVSDDISTKIYGSGGKELMCNPSGNLIVEIVAGNVDISGGVVSKLQDGSGNPIYSSSHALNVYNTRYTLPTTDSIKSYTVDGSGNNINSTSNALNVYNTRYLEQSTDTIKSYTVDGSGNNINSTSNALNVYNTKLLTTTDQITSHIVDTAGNSINSTSNALNVYNTRLLTTSDSVKAYMVDGTGNSLNSTSNALNVYNSNIDSIYNLLNTRGTATLLNSSSSEFSSSVNFTNINIKSITIYGSCSASTTLTLQCSNDGSTWYSSQYTIVMTTANSFGFGLSGFCPRYLRLRNQDLATVTAYIDYC